MTRVIILLTVLILLTAGCSKRVHSASYRLNGMDSTQSELANDQIKVYEIGQQEAFLHSLDPDSSITIKFGNLEEDMIGLAEIVADSCEITIHNNLDPTKYSIVSERFFAQREFAVTLAHEIGHCFGLEHDPKPNEIMSAYYTYESGEPEAFDRFHAALRAKRRDS